MTKEFTKDKVIITKICSITNKEYKFELPINDYNHWQNGALIQFVFPDIPREEREILISGHTPAEWKQLFG